MFNSARLKLTAWYLVIIMTISLAFSVVIYRMLTFEVDRLLERQQFRIEQQLNDPEFFPSEMRNRRSAMPLLDPLLVEELKGRLILNLAGINVLILFGAGGLGFVLAGKTLLPIKRMLDEQNRFIADASHELRTPITALKTTLEVNLRDESLSLKEARQVLKSNLEDVNHLQRLSSALLEMAQVQEKSAGAIVPTELATAVTGASKIVAPLAKKKQITVQIDESTALVNMPYKELSDILVILLDNAIKYSPNKTTVTLAIVEKRKWVVLSVTDQGRGIALSDLPHIFDRFYQVEASRTTGEKHGYGLGLAIAKKTIEQYRGSIAVSSTLNTGSTFALHLPRA